MSLQLDLPETNYSLSTFDGLWIKERHKNQKKLVSGAYINESTTGASSNRHNPFLCLEKEGCTSDLGECIGVNLIYSGNHYESVEVSEYGKLRVLTGIQPKQFSWKLEKGGIFYAPEAVLNYSFEGTNAMSQKLSAFTRSHIVHKHWRNAERPILVNNWEATYFDFNRAKILAIAKEAKELGMELFVLDDGWFGERSDDKKGLGDWYVNEKKMGGSLQALVEKINKMGLDFGLWMEPEMVNEDSNLYREHPDWAVQIPNRTAYLGRNQLVLDYANPEVCDHIVKVISDILESANISYVKWDMNRHISDAYSKTLGDRQREFHHRYVLGLYDVMGRIVEKFPEILFESCSSGGNRFDLGMLYYMPQTWTSDDTDANERVLIQEGTSYGYPISAMGAHVSAAPNHQTLRHSSIETRFQVACFGDLGYELDLTKLTGQEKKIVKNQIAFYKKYRKTLQFGDFYREKVSNGNTIWASVSPDQEEAVVLLYQAISKPNTSSDILRVPGLDPYAKYHIKARKIAISIKEFGSLVNMVSPLHITEDGMMQSLVNKVYMMEGEEEEYTARGDLLMYGGIKLKQRFIGTGYNANTRLMGDFSSRLYVLHKEKE
jgi:alpha-galactosidase